MTCFSKARCFYTLQGIFRARPFDADRPAGPLTPLAGHEILLQLVVIFRSERLFEDGGVGPSTPLASRRGVR